MSQFILVTGLHFAQSKLISLLISCNMELEMDTHKFGNKNVQFAFNILAKWTINRSPKSRTT